MAGKVENKKLEDDMTMRTITCFGDLISYVFSANVSNLKRIRKHLVQLFFSRPATTEVCVQVTTFSKVQNLGIWWR